MGKKEAIIIDYLSQPEVFAALFNGYVFGGKQIIQSEDLRETDGRLRFLLTDIESKDKKSTYEVIERERDIVREVIIGEQTVCLTILGVEHQSEIDYSMVLRTLTYDTLEYLKQAKAIEREHKRKKDVKGREFLSCFKKDDILLPTITIVFYTGKEKWDAARDLKGLFGTSPYLEQMLPFMVTSPLNLISIYDVEDPTRYHGSLRKVFELLRYTEDKNAMTKYLDDHAEVYSKLDEATARLLALLLDLQLSDKEVRTREGGLDMCKALEDMKKEAEEKGEERGEEKGITKIIVSMLDKDMTCEEIAALTDVPLEQIKRIAETEQAAG